MRHQKETKKCLSSATAEHRNNRKRLPRSAKRRRETVWPVGMKFCPASSVMVRVVSGADFACRAKARRPVVFCGGNLTTSAEFLCKRAQPERRTRCLQHFHRHRPQYLAFLCAVLLLASVSPPNLPHEGRSRRECSPKLGSNSADKAFLGTFVAGQKCLFEERSRPTGRKSSPAGRAKNRNYSGSFRCFPFSSSAFSAATGFSICARKIIAAMI